MGFFFFGNNGKLCLATDDSLPLDYEYHPELSQVKSIYDKYPPDHYDPLVDGVDPTLDSPLGNHLPDNTEDDSVSDYFGKRSGFVFPISRAVWFLADFWLHLGGSNPLRLVFPAPFSWAQGWGGVLVCPWSILA